MYLIDKSRNRIEKLKKKSFTELGFKERESFQEWIANTREVFGEELLIIQEEFDGCSDTKELRNIIRSGPIALKNEGKEPGHEGF